jgi:type VI protein secretion system component VasK
MWRRLFRLTAVVLVWAVWAAPALAQAQPAESDAEAGPTYALPYTVALLSTLLVLLIVCKPSRKS